MADEKKRVSEAYVIEFYNDVIALTRWYANYMTIGLELEAKYGKDTIISKAPENEMAELKNILINLRYHILKSYIYYESIIGGLKQNVDSRLGKLYLKFNENYLITREDLEEYVKAINSVLIENAELKYLLESSISVVNELYDRQQQPEPKP